MSRQGRDSRGATGVAMGSALAGRPPVPSVNLIPASVGRAQASRAMQAKALVVLAAVVLVLGGGYAGLAWWKGTADARVQDARDQATSLTQQKAKYADLISLKQQLADAEAAEVAAMAYEVAWADMVQAMVDTRPPNSLVASIAGVGMSATMQLTPSPNVLARPAVGRITVEILVTSMEDAAAWVVTLNATPGLENAYYSSLDRENTASEVEIFRIRCSAEVNLAGLTGKALPEEFKTWLTEQRTGEAETPAEDQATEEEGGDE